MIPERFLIEARQIVAETAWRHSGAEGLMATSTRGRTARLGGVEFLDPSGGRAGRTNPQTQVTRPGFRFNAQIRTPSGVNPIGSGGTGGGGGLAALFDPSSAATWRLVAVALAFAYVVGFHVTLSGIRLGLGPGR